MSVVINTNVDSLKIQNILSGSTNKLSSAMQRMSTGLKVNSAKDDAAGTVISARMQVQLDGNEIAQKNVQNGNAMLATAEGHLDVVEDNLVRIRDLTLQAKNGTYSAEEIKAMQDEVGERIQEIDRISKSSKYSSLKLFDDAKLQEKGVTFQVGANADENNVIQASKDLFAKVEFKSLTNTNTDFDLTKMSAPTFKTAIENLDKAIDNVTGRKSTIGSVQNRLESALDTLTTQFENLSSAKSIITDADIAAEASKFTQQNILQQVATSLLAQANQAPGIALSLV
jgi:flagellin